MQKSDKVTCPECKRSYRESWGGGVFHLVPIKSSKPVAGPCAYCGGGIPSRYDEQAGYERPVSEGAKA